MAEHPNLAAGSTRHLVAPELRPALENVPSFDFTPEVLDFIRAGGGRPEDFQPPPIPPVLEPFVPEERYVPGPKGAPEVRVLIYTPPGKSEGPRPAFFHVHGGGYVIGNPEINDISNRATVAALGCVLVSVDYRLAPETRFPGALEDCYAALKWLYENAESLGVDRDHIAIGGESAGGGHAASLAILARDRGEVPICLQLLDSPMLDDRTGSAHDPHPYCGEYVWTPSNNRFGWAALLGIEPGGVDVPEGAVPARTEDLSGLPPAFILVGGIDLFLEEDLEYARRLARAGVPIELHVIPGAFHGFFMAGPDAPQVRAAFAMRNEALARAFAQ